VTRLWNWGVGVATVYAMFAGATLAFVTFAMSERVDLVSPDYYGDSLSHDARQQAASRALALGPAFRIDHAGDGRSVAITWPASAVPPAGRIHFYRPSDSSADRSQNIAPDAAGRQVVQLEGFAAGAWTVQCDWTVAGTPFYAERQIVVK
jgi:hypothetical protein